MKTRRILSSILSFVMIFTLVVYSPRVTFAENNTAPASESVQDDGKKDNLQAEDSLEGMVEESEDDKELNDGTSGNSDESKDSSESKDTSESKSTDESQDADESKSTDESKGTDESKDADESKGTDESKDADESKGTDESKDVDESNGTDESKDTDESIGTDESKDTDESNSTDESKEIDESKDSDESKETGSADDAADESKESSSAADESSASDEKESSAASDESSASDEKEGSAVNDESSAIDESGSIGDQEESSPADESSEAETGAADESTSADDNTQNGSTGGGSASGGGSGTTLASDSNASVGGGGGTGTITAGDTEDRLPTKEELEEMSMAEIYELFWSLDVDDQDKLMDLMSEEDREEFLDFMWKSGLGEIVEVSRNIVSYTEVGPFLPPVSGPVMRTLARFAMRSLAAEEPDWTEPDGIEVRKSVSDEMVDGKYWLTLESWVTGDVRIVSEEEKVPTDIVLVLDQSGSMANKDFTEYVTYRKVENQKNQSLYKNSNNLYYKVNDETYTKVSVSERNGTYTYRFNDGSGQQTITSRGANSIPTELKDKLYTRQDSNKISRGEALKSAAETFVENVLENNVEDGVVLGHRIAVVGFAHGSEAYNRGGTYIPAYGNTEVLTVMGDSPVAYDKTNATIYKDALMPVSDSEEGNVLNSKIDRAIDWLDAKGATQVDLGLEMAQKILQQNKPGENEKRNQVVVVLTDGVPTSGSSFENSVANDAISLSKSMKQGGVTVYSIGIFDGAAPTADISPTNNENETKKANRFMHYISSNYPNASNISNGGSKADDGYYLAASNVDELTDIFTQISEGTSGGANITSLNEQTVLKDVITDSFMLPEGTKAEDIEVYTAEFNGKVDGEYTWKAPVEYDEAVINVDEEKTVTVSGFNYSSNFVGEEESSSGGRINRGKKLIVRIPITPDYSNGTFGGGIENTNTNSSGIYTGTGTPVEPFEPPHAYIPVRYEMAAANQAIYLTKAPEFDKLIAYANGFEPDGDNNENVTIVYTIKDENNEIVATYTIPAGQNTGVLEPQSNDTISLMEDTVYTVSCTVTPATAGKNALTLNEASTVYVVRPQITFKDSLLYLGETAPTDADYTANNLESSISWISETKPLTVDVIGNAPTITYTFKPDATTNFQKDTYVGVTETIGTTDITAYVTALHANCDEVSPCQFEKEKGQFIVHVKTCTLTVVKNISNEVEDLDQVFLFTVTDSNGAEWHIPIVGKGSKTITNLPIGNYTVREDTDWSWRYTCIEQSGNVTLSSQNPNGSVTITNTLSNNQWLSDETQGNNVFEPVSQTGTQHAFMRREEKYEFI